MSCSLYSDDDDQFNTEVARTLAEATLVRGIAQSLPRLRASCWSWSGSACLPLTGSSLREQ